MRYISVCSGIEAATVAWHQIGWEAQAFSDIESFPRAVIKHHYPDVPCHGDFTTMGKNDYGTTELLVGGTPCQDFSVAGLRKGINGDRGNLTIEFLRLATRLSSNWVVWENVPGILSIDGGKAFGTFLGGLAKCGYGFAYRVLDAQYFGVPQRRRRVFVVGYLGDWRPAAAVLFERKSLCGDITPRREAGEDIARTITTGIGSRYDGETDTFVIPINTQIGLRGETSNTTREGLGIGRANDPAFTLQASHGHAVAIPINAQAIRSSKGGKGREDDGRGNGLGVGASGDPANTLTCAEQHAVAYGMHVRRLTPLECERLQGFPDNYTAVPFGNKIAGDGVRYKALGNSMAVPVMKWIGERIKIINAIKRDY